MFPAPRACRITHVPYAGFGSQLPSLTNRNVELAAPPLFWPVNCIKIGGHVALVTVPSVYFLYCDKSLQEQHLTGKTAGQACIFKVLKPMFIQ